MREIHDSFAAGDGIPNFYEAAAAMSAAFNRMAVFRSEAAEILGVSVGFFDAHIAPELASIPRGRRRLYPIASILRWIVDSAEVPDAWHLTPSPVDGDDDAG